MSGDGLGIIAAKACDRDGTGVLKYHNHTRLYHLNCLVLYHFNKPYKPNILLVFGQGFVLSTDAAW